MLSIVAAIAISSAPTELNAYVYSKSRSVHWSAIGGRSGFPKAIALTSQRWHGIDWKHEISFVFPQKLDFKGYCMINVTGDRTGERDEIEAKSIADLAGMPVATLYQIPNQPLFGAKEDALIAISFQKFLETEDPSWPLLFPMTKSVIESINAIQTTTKKGTNPIKKFIVFGGSKRGWTTWLAGGTGDPRIVGLAPIVFDNLNIVAQMKHQKSAMGDYSPMIKDYVESGMLDALETPMGKKLASLVDPISYLSKVKAPVFLINGGNDPFWAPDANALYWKALTMPKSSLSIPNVGHTLGQRQWMVSGLGAFANFVALRKPMPMVTAKIVPTNAGLRFEANSSGKPVGMTIYSCAYSGWEFARAPWRVIKSKPNVTKIDLLTAGPQEGFVAVTAVSEYRRNGKPFWVSSLPIVIPGRESHSRN